MILGHPALRLLARLKFKASLRRQLRRLKRPSGWIFALLGLLLIGGWLASLLFGHALHVEDTPIVAGRFQLVGTELAIAMLFVVTILGAVSHRGLYLPKEEIERLFAAPVTRADLVRYRLVTNLFRSLFAGAVFGLLSFGRLPSKAFGFAGIVLTLLTLPLVGQAASLVFGDAENRLGKLVSGRWTRVLYGLAAVGLWILIMGLVFSHELARGDGPGVWRVIEGLIDSRATSALLVPFHPWAALVNAADGPAFTKWFAVCLVIWVVMFELCARIPIDYRELSLETSADVARRLNRLRRGGLGAGAGRASKRTVGWRVPWLFGHGPFGAVAWLKLGAILRKARGTVVVSSLVVGGLTLAFTLAFPQNEIRDALIGACMIAVLGTFYLCAGLRFDFRADLEQMETIKAWPVRPPLVFLATLLPEVVLVSVVLGGAILVRGLVTGNFHPALLGIAAALPPVILAWVALDNAVFLFAPVRYVPGQEGALHHMGRSLVLMFLRLALLALVAGISALPAVGIWFAATGPLGLTPESALWLCGSVAWLVLVGLDCVLVLAGGELFRRFDVALDRG